MKVRRMKHKLPHPQRYTLGASVFVPEYEGPFGTTMNTVRLHIVGSCMSGEPDHRACMARISAARDAYIAGLARKEGGNG